MGQGIDQVVGATLVSVRHGPGMRLRAAREAAGYTPEDIASQLRLHPSVIKSIEEDCYDKGLPLVFIKGYLRSYATYMNIDPEQVIIEFTHLGLPEPVRFTPERGYALQKDFDSFQPDLAQHRSLFIWGSLGVLVCAMLGYMWSQHDSAPVSEPIAANVSVMPAHEETELNAALDAAHAGATTQPAAKEPTVAQETPAPAKPPVKPSAANEMTIVPAPIKPIAVKQSSQKHSSTTFVDEVIEDTLLF